MNLKRDGDLPAKDRMTEGLPIAGMAAIRKHHVTGDHSG